MKTSALALGAIAMQKCLEDLSRQAGIVPEWKTLLRDLDRLQRRAAWRTSRIRSESSLEIADANAFGLASEHLHKIGIAPEPELRNQLRAWRVTRLRFAYAERGGGQQGGA